MRISRISIRKLALPMAMKFKISVGEVAEKETVIVALYADNGLTGYGESTVFKDPVFNNETAGETIYALEKLIAPKVVGKDFETPEDFIAAYSDIAGYASAKTGLECAFWHLVAQRDNKSLRELFGGVNSEIAAGESIGIKSTLAETLEEAESRLRDGFKRIKLKITPGWDIEIVKAARQQWPNIDLTVDANAAYNLAEHENIFRELENHDLQMIEQPFGADNVSDHAALQKLVKTPICLDESIRSLADAKRFIAAGACKIINMKPIRIGGILECLKIHDYAASRGIGMMCGGMLETGIGRAFNIALASKSNFIYPADMSPYYIYFFEDLIHPSFELKQNGCIDVPTAPGLGYTIREDLIEKYTAHEAAV
jgi:O-succinylbenzoate synthase